MPSERARDRARPALRAALAAAVCLAAAFLAGAQASGSSAPSEAPAPSATPAPPEEATPSGAPPSGTAPAEGGDASPSQAEEPPVGPEDLLEISVFEIPDLNRQVRVTEQGTISLPLLGEIRVVGLSPMQLEARLRDELAKKYLEDPQVSVFVREHGSKKVSVLGAVGKPGVYEMLGPRTLLQVLSEAGGLTKDVGAELYVIRQSLDGGGRKITVSVPDLMIGRDPALNLDITPGDIVTVPMDRPIYIYVDGAVKSPGRLDELASRPISLGQAIAKAGGLTERANLKSIQVLRKQRDGTTQTLTANLSRIRKGKEQDQILQDGDVVVVPETFF